MSDESEILNQAMRLHMEGDLVQAERIYRELIATAKHPANALHSLGVLQSQLGFDLDAIEWMKQAVECEPLNPKFHLDLGMLTARTQRFSEAIGPFQQSIALKPVNPEAYNELGNAYRGLGNFEMAIQAYRQSLRFQPDSAMVYSNLGLSMQDRGEFLASIEAFQNAIRLMPNVPDVHLYLGNSLNDVGNYDLAIQSYQQAIALHPDFFEAYNNLGNVFMERRRFDDAVIAYQTCLRLQPDSAETYFNLGNTYQELKQTIPAIDAYRQALRLKPNYVVVQASLLSLQQYIAEWDDVEELSQQVIESVERDDRKGAAELVTPFHFITLPVPTTPAQQLRNARQWVREKFEAAYRANTRTTTNRPRLSTSKIRLGYLSADFHSHATTSLIAELIEVHDRQQFEIIGYSYGKDDGSPSRQRIVKAFDQFREMRNMSFSESANLIASDGIDILIDLKGFTAHARTEILTFRPAPIQVNYLGYPGTMGADFVDYIFVDDFIVPADQQIHFPERLVHLPHSYQVNDSRIPIASHTPSRRELGLPEKGFVFCSFNSLYKITRPMFNVWMRLVLSVPGSVLWLLETNPIAKENLWREAESRGVSRDRLVFVPIQAHPEHLARHRLADLCLDAYPVNAHTTASDALRMGVPLVTLAGQSLVSRVAGSLLRAVDMPELITTHLDDYERLARTLAQQPELLAAVRAKLSKNLQSSPLFDGQVFARNIERAYRAIWDRYLRGEPPSPLSIASDESSRHSAQSLFETAIQLYQAGQNEQSTLLFQQLLQSNSNEPSLWFYLGLTQAARNEWPSAIASYRQAIGLHPNFAEAYNNLGNVYRIQADFTAAEHAYRQAIANREDFAEAYGNLGLVLQDQGKLDAAIDAYQHALRIRPESPEVFHNLGNLFQSRGDLVQAVAAYRRTIELNPNIAKTHNNLGNALRDLGDAKAALQAYESAIAIDPNYADAIFNAANLIELADSKSEAVDWYRRVLSIDVDFLPAKLALIRIEHDLCQWDISQDLAKQVLQALDKSVPHASEHWVSPLSIIGLPIPTTAEQQWRIAKKWTSRLTIGQESIEKIRSLRSRSQSNPHARLRIGYLSSDFGTHPVSYLIAELFEAHDRQRFEIFGYTLSPSDGSLLGQRIEKSFDRYQSLENLPFEQAAERIARDQIDILVDLQGYTRGAKTEILALRPAPIQVNYLGFAGTTGADFIDYILVDDFVVPEHQQSYFSERLVHLPQCFMVNDRFRQIDPRTPSRREAGLPEKGFVFCAFSAAFKITPSMFELWLRLLKAIPESVLWLRLGNPEAVANLQSFALAHGVSKDRLIFSPTVSMPEHLARHRLANLYLDTFPYNQHSTASDAIRMGVPLITIAGQTFASRVAGSLLQAVGMTELITESFAAYEALAIRLASHPNELADIRRRLAANLDLNPLYDGRAFAKKLEATYQSLIENEQGSFKREK